MYVCIWYQWWFCKYIFTRVVHLQIIINTHMYRFRCQNVTVYLRPVHTNVNSSGHFILIDVRQSTQTTVPRQPTLHNVCMLSSFWGKTLLLDRCFHPLPNIFSSIILIYTFFYYYHHHFNFYTFHRLHTSDNDQITYLGFTFVLKKE